MYIEMPLIDDFRISTFSYYFYRLILTHNC